MSQFHVFLNMWANVSHVPQPSGHQLWTFTPFQGKSKGHHQFGGHLCSGLLFLPLHPKVSKQLRREILKWANCHPIVTERECAHVYICTCVCPNHTVALVHVPTALIVLILDLSQKDEEQEKQ